MFNDQFDKVEQIGRFKMTPNQKWESLRRHTLSAYREALIIPGRLSEGFLIGLKMVLDGMDALDAQGDSE